MLMLIKTYHLIHSVFRVFVTDTSERAAPKLDPSPSIVKIRECFLIEGTHPNLTKVDGPNSLTFLIRTPIFERYVVR